MLCHKFTHIKFIYQQYTDMEHFNMSVRSEIFILSFNPKPPVKSIPDNRVFMLFILF